MRDYKNAHRLRALRAGERIVVDGKTIEASGETLAPGVTYYAARNGEMVGVVKYIHEDGWVCAEDWLRYPYDVWECEPVWIVEEQS